MSAANLLGGAVSVPQPKLADLGSWSGQSAAMVAGTVSVAIPFLPASAAVLLSAVGTGVAQANAGALSYQITTPGAAGATLVIYSTNNADTRAVSYLCVATA